MKSETKNEQQHKEINGIEAYKIALETRNFEIGLFWQRSNYFLALNAALSIGFFRITNDTHSILFAFLGVFVSILWYKVNLGSKYWQARWEYRLSLKEEEIANGLEFFSADAKLIQSDVEKSFEHGAAKKRKFQKWVEKQALKKPSVSYNMILLSLMFVVTWGWLLITKILPCEKLKEQLMSFVQYY